MKTSGFTLVELIVAAAILAIGMVFVIRSFFTVQDSLRVTQDKFMAMKLLGVKANELELKVYKAKGYSPKNDIQEELDFGVKKAIYTVKTLNLKKDKPKEENNSENNPGKAGEKESKKDPFSEVELRLSWVDHGNKDHENLIIYFKNKEQ
jgi:prepilin-type N-terminal cleavage/methylation domain-containing protein